MGLDWHGMERSGVARQNRTGPEGNGMDGAGKAWLTRNKHRKDAG
jgi:hypothetical protein